ESGRRLAVETFELMVLSSLAAVYLPLTRVRNISALRLQRRETGEEQPQRTKRLSRTKIAVLACVAGFVVARLLFPFSALLTPVGPAVFSSGCIVFLVIYCLALTPAKFFRRGLKYVPLRLPWQLRQALANLHR